MHFLLWTKWSHQGVNFDTIKCSGENFPNSSCHFLGLESVFPQILYASSVSWKINPLYFFRSIVIYFSQRGPTKVQIFETFVCLDQNSLNSCHFWENKLVFLQIFYHFSVSSDITPLYFFSWNYTYFQQKGPLKYKFGEFHVSSRKSEILHFDGPFLSKSDKF